MHPDVLFLPDIFLRADGKSLNIHDFFIAIARPLLAWKRGVHDADREQVGVDVFVAARVLREVGEAMVRSLMIFDEIV